jgi:DNA-binding CsgD family transcriptional regulator
MAHETLDDFDTVIDPRALLSPRELDVLRLTSLGLTNSAIATRLSVSVHAVKFHLAAIYRKLGVANRTEAAGVFLRAVAPAGQSHEIGEGQT